jgi:hypothetical protein
MPSDSTHVVEFMTLFASVRERVGGDPTRLFDLAHSDSNFREVCVRLSDTHFFLDYLNQKSRHKYIVPVNPDFVQAWREYEARYAALINPFAAAAMGLGDLPETPSEPRNLSSYYARFESADEEGRRLADAIRAALDLAHTELEQGDYLTDEHALSVADGLNAWDSLSDKIGLDFQGVFRRKRLLSIILVPRHVSDKHGSAERMSLYTYLTESQDAFVRGTPYASLIMMRAIIELVLTRHYGAAEFHLKDKIESCKLLPPGAGSNRLLRIKELADSVVHPRSKDRRRNGRLAADIRSLDTSSLERELISSLEAVRILIEEAPE